jgi:polysaccharide pyruvyl transferase WcaK-like protein
MTDADPLGPFFLDPDRFPDDAVLGYASCGAPDPFDEEHHAVIRTALEAAALIWVRDPFTVRRLRDTGYEGRLQVAPDVAVMTGDLVPREELAAQSVTRHAKRWRRDKPYVCFQMSAAHLGSAAAMAEGLVAFRRRSGIDVLLLPLAETHGDRGALRDVAAATNNALEPPRSWSPDATLRLLANATGFVGSSMHGAIVSWSYGVPFLTLPIEGTKIDGFRHQVGLPDDVAVTPDSLTARMLAQLDERKSDEAELSNARARTTEAFAELLEVLDR